MKNCELAIVSTLTCIAFAIAVPACKKPEGNQTPMNQKTDAVIEPTTIAATPSEPIFEITDIYGKTFRVTQLRAKYSAGGIWMGNAPVRESGSFLIVIKIAKERITTQEEFDHPLISIKRLTQSLDEVSVNYKKLLSGYHEPVTIEKSDDTILLFNDRYWLEFDALGKEMRRLSIDYYELKAGTAQGEAISLSSFLGRASNSNGQDGEFRISWDEVRSIALLSE